MVRDGHSVQMSVTRLILSSCKKPSETWIDEDWWWSAGDVESAPDIKTRMWETKISSHKLHFNETFEMTILWNYFSNVNNTQYISFTYILSCLSQCNILMTSYSPLVTSSGRLGPWPAPWPELSSVKMTMWGQWPEWAPWSVDTMVAMRDNDESTSGSPWHRVQPPLLWE